MSRDRAWFVNVFCGGEDPGIGGDEEVWDFTANYQQYDTLAVVAAVPRLREEFFDPIEVTIGDQEHEIIGLTSERNGIRDADELRDYVVGVECFALSEAVQAEAV